MGTLTLPGPSMGPSGRGQNGRSTAWMQEGGQTVTEEFTQRPGWVASRSAQVRLSFNYRIGWLANRLEGVLRLKPDTCVPVTDPSPQAILWAEHSRIQNKHLSQRACVSFNRVQIDCPETLMLFYFFNPSAAAEGIPWAPILPTSQDLTHELCCYCSFSIVLKQCPR